MAKSGCRYIGDVGNIMEDAMGNAKGESTDGVISLAGSNSIYGRSVVVSHWNNFHTKEIDVAKTFSYMISKLWYIVARVY